MKIVVPMAGKGTRMRPHTLTTPKPMTPIAGKPIVQRLLEDIAKVCPEKIEEIAYVIGDFGEEVEKALHQIAENLGAKASIYYQEEPLGTAHAVLCAEPSLNGKVVVAFADTLFKANFTLDIAQDATIWVQSVPDPSAFGVVKIDSQERVTDFVEKPKDFISDLAIIGIYYVREAEILKKELQFLVENNIRNSNEYQLTTALENMRRKGSTFRISKIDEWLDCGNKDATVFTNQRYLEYIKDTKLIADSAKIVNTVIIPPVFVAEGVELYNSVIGPHVSIGSYTKIEHSMVRNSIVQQHTHIENANMQDSMIGNHVKYYGKSSDLSIGDYTMVK